MPLRAERHYLQENRDPFEKPAEILTASITLARAMYKEFGSVKTGGLHIPAAYPERPWEIKQRHVYLRLS